VSGEALPEVTVQLPYDPVRLAQDVHGELAAGRPFAEPNLVVVPSVTREAIKGAVQALARSGRWFGRPARPRPPWGSPNTQRGGLQHGPIKVLVALESIRVLPGMYIGPAGATANRLCAASPRSKPDGPRSTQAMRSSIAA
jgi:hypothetical protein